MLHCGHKKKREPPVAVPPLEAFALPESVERTTHKAHADMNITIPFTEIQTINLS